MLKDIWQMLWKRRVFIIAIGLTGMLLGIAYAFVTKPRYAAGISFTLDDNQSSGGLGGIAAEFGFDLGGLSGGTTPIFSGENILGLISSTKVCNEVLLSKYPGSSLSFADVYIQQNELWEDKNLRFPYFKVGQASFTRLQDSMMQYLGNELTKKTNASRPDKKVYIFTVDVNTRNEDYSIAYVHALMDVVAKMYLDIKTSKSRLNISILEKKADSVFSLINSGIDRRAQILDANLNPVFQAPQTGVQKSQLLVQANSRVYEELIKQLELARYGLLYQTPLITLIDTPRRPLKKIKPGKIVYGLGLGILFGLLACGWVYFRNLLQKEKNI